MRWLRGCAVGLTVVTAAGCGGGAPGSPGGGRSWGEVVSLDIVTGGTANIVAPFAGVDANGNAIVVWGVQDRTTGVGTDFAASYLPGQGWQAKTQVSIGLDTTYAVMAGSRAFVRAAGTPFRLASIDVANPGAGWTEHESLAGESPGGPVLVATGAGDVFVVWEPRVDGARLRVARYRQAGGWSTPATLAEDPGAATGIPSYGSISVGVDATGVLAVAWDESRSDFNGALFARYTEAAGWSQPQVLEAMGRISNLAVASNGGGVVVWYGAQGVTAARFDTATGPGAPESLGTTNDTPQVSVSESGHALVVWRAPRDATAAAAGLLDVAGSRYDPGSGWRAIGLFPPDPSGMRLGADSAAAALDSGGNGLVVSNSESGFALSVFGYSPAGPSPPRVVETIYEAFGITMPPANTTLGFGTPALAMNGAGAAVLYYTASTVQGSVIDKQLRATIFPP